MRKQGFGYTVKRNILLRATNGIMKSKDRSSSDKASHIKEERVAEEKEAILWNWNDVHLAFYVYYYRSMWNADFQDTTSGPFSDIYE